MDDLFIKIYKECEECNGSGILFNISTNQFDIQCPICFGSGKKQSFIDLKTFRKEVFPNMSYGCVRQITNEVGPILYCEEGPKEEEFYGEFYVTITGLAFEIYYFEDYFDRKHQPQLVHLLSVKHEGLNPENLSYKELQNYAKLVFERKREELYKQFPLNHDDILKNEYKAE